MRDENIEIQQNVSLWNPKAAAAWSILFSPVFGAWIHAKNWGVLGCKEKAKHSMYWVYGGIVMFLFIMFIPNNISKFIGIGYFLTWYISFAQQQEKHVQENLGGIYDKKGWGKALGIAVVGLVGLFIVASTVIINFDSEFQTDSALEDISGVWRANTDGTIVILKVAGQTKSIEINEKIFSVSVKGYDHENKITTFIVNNNLSMIWSVRQLFDDEGRFSLKLTLQDGAEDGLSFVRNL